MATFSELQSELAKLEAELLELRHDTEPDAPKSGRRGRRARLLRELAMLESQIERSDDVLGMRELTPKERVMLSRFERFGYLLLGVGGLILSGHVAHRATLTMLWRETPCTVVLSGDTYIAHAEPASGARPYRFPTGDHETGKSKRCWVPEPPLLADIGRVELPPSRAVPLATKLSVGWIMVAIIAALFGGLFLVFNSLDRQARLANRKAKDDFSEPD